MSGTTKALGRLGIAGVAAVTLAAGVPAFFATPASAAPAATIDLDPETTTTAPNQCTTFTVTLRDASGGQATETGTVTISLSENPPSNTQDVRFCAPEGADATTGASESRVASQTFPGVNRFTFGLLSTTPGGATIVATGTAASGARLVGDNSTASFSTAASSPMGSFPATPATPASTSTSPSPIMSSNPQPSPSATMSPTRSPAPSTTQTGRAIGCERAAEVMLERSTITATGSAAVRVTTTPNSTVDLFAYTRPSTTFRLIRSAEVGADGVADFRIVPPANTRLRAQQRGCAFGPDKVLNVRTALSLNVTRTGTRAYRFFGDSLPARRGSLIISLYRVTANGSQILTSQTRASETNGEWVINRRFTGTGRFGFVVRTGQDLQNAPGASNLRSLLVF